MIRRQFIGVIPMSGIPLLSGCTNSQQELPDEGVLWITNYTDADQIIEVLIRDETDNTVFSEQYELTPDDTEDNIVTESGVGDAENTYYVEVTTNDHEGEFEWEMARSRSILNIYIEDSEVRFERDAPEG